MPLGKQPIFDVDQHYYEPLDAFTRHLPAKWKSRTVQQIDVEGRTRFLVALAHGGWSRVVLHNILRRVHQCEWT